MLVLVNISYNKTN